MSCGGISFPANCVTINGTLTNAFETISVPNGTNPVAEVYNDTLTLTSADSTITITGTAASDSIDFVAREASSLVSGIVSTTTQTFAGRKTFNSSVVLSANLNYAWTQDAASTGANANLSNHPTVGVEVTNASLTSVAKLDSTSTSAGHMIIVRNKTGAAITIVDQIDVSGDQIVTGTGANVTLANNASVTFMRDRTASFWAVVAVSSGVTAHNQLTGLTSGDDHTQYFLLSGRSGGSIGYGGTGSGDDLTLRSTSHATKGNIFLGTASTYDEANDRFGMGTLSPAVKIHQDGGNATATYHKFTAGSTTGTTSADGFDIGIDSSGNVEIRQRENLAITAYTNNTARLKIQPIGRVTVGDTSEGSPFFTNDGQKFLVNGAMTTVGGNSVSDLIQILSCTSADFAPASATNTGLLGFSLYSAQGFTADTTGTNAFNGGIPVFAMAESFSCVGAFGQVNVGSSASVDGVVGLGCTSNHQGRGSTATTQVGGAFSVENTDEDGLGTPTGSISLAIAGNFAAAFSGVDVTSAIAARFTEPYAWDAGSGAGTPALTNKTAISCNGTMSITESTVASAASITNMTVATSHVYLTGSTATTLHSINQDTFNKLLILINRTGANLTIKNESGTEGTAARRIVTATGADVVSTGNSAHIFIYSTSAARWILIGGDL